MSAFYKTIRTKLTNNSEIYKSLIPSPEPSARSEEGQKDRTGKPALKAGGLWV